MSGIPLDPDQDRARARNPGRLILERRGVLVGVRREDPVVVVPGRDEDGRVARARPDVVERRIRPQVAEPLRGLARPVVARPGGADREPVVAEHVHDADPGKRDGADIRALVEDGADQEPAV